MLPYNDLAAVAAAFAEHGPTIACVITEAAAGQHGRDRAAARVQRRAARHQPRARRAADHGRGDDRVPGVAVGLVRPRARGRRPVHVRQGDERRAARGGVRRIAPTIMAQLAPAGPVYQAGHAVGQPGRGRRRAGDAAGRRRARLRRAGRATPRGSATWSARRSPPRASPHRVQYAGNLFSVFFTERRVRDFAGAQAAADLAVPGVLPRDARRGVYLPPSAFEAWFVTAALDDDCFGGRVGPRAAAAPPRRRPPLTPPADATVRPAGGTRSLVVTERSSTCCGTARCTTPTASSTAGCPASGSPSAGARQAEIVRRRRSPAPTSTTLARVADGARAGDRGAHRRTAHDLPVARRRRADRGGQPVRGPPSVGVGDGALRDPRNWPLLRNPFTPVVGRAVPARSRTACWARCTGRARAGRGARGAVRVATSCRSGRCAGSSRASGSGTTRAAGSARWRRSPRCVFDGTELTRLAYTEPAGASAPTATGA